MTKELKEMVEKMRLINDISETLFGNPYAELKEDSKKVKKYLKLSIPELKKALNELTKA